MTHAILNHLRHDWEVIVSGVNYDGSAHELPYEVMPAWQGGDMWGMNRFRHLCTEFDPAAVVINNDWWNVAEFTKIAPEGVRITGYMPVDGGNLDPAAMQELNRLHAAVWYTDFGHQAAVAGGFTGRRHVIPHGIDTEVFQPVDRHEARRQMGLSVPADAFIVGNVNRNQPRKRLDLTIQIFAAWIKQHNIADAYLLLHCAQRDTGWDLRRVAGYHGVADRLIFTGADNIRDMQEASRLKQLYSSLDLQMTTTLGEGWGLTTMEGMACGVPQIVPEASALGEWATPAVKIPCSRTLFHPEINTTGSLVDEAPFVAALQALYQSEAERCRLAAEGLAHVRHEAFRWETVARQFQALLPAAPRQAKRRQTTQSRQLSSRA
ncbi:MAG: glycosyltransferase family 4 protein [Verrucomicrobia bacterium]|nr:glycosyltransferase family 4 protein [Verrucomicrobiota bacterium]